MKRKKEILKDRERFNHRLRTATWSSPNADVIFRLNCLIQFHPDKTNRQIFNHAKTNTEYDL